MSAIEKLIGEPETSEMGRLPDNHVTRDKPHSRALPGLTKKGTRPRFKLVGPEADLFVVLREIDITLRAASLEPDRWLRTPARSNPLAGKTPIAYITSAGVAGALDVLRLAAQEGFRGSMA